ncbi:MAG: hypothetical protein JNL28_14695 [Planctomycetes bacterium]|nr:hypothetical protein [Planctomycetota bacterium]
MRRATLAPTKEPIMSKEMPDHRDAELVIKLYDLRREPVMRQARAAINGWLPRNWDEMAAIMQPTHPLNASWRQVSSYWEMVYSMGRHGIVHPDFFVENNAEGLLLFAKVAPYLERMRKEMSPTAFQSAEWATRESASGKLRFALFQKRIEQMLKAQG